MREVQLSTGDAVVLYDTSGPYTDSDYQADVRRGLPALRDGWIAERSDTEDYEGRSIRPEDNGRTQAGGRNLDEVFAGSTRRTRRAVAGRVVTQLAYARRGTSLWRWSSSACEKESPPNSCATR
jgi:phosphomethylpyrimidine synthase